MVRRDVAAVSFADSLPEAVPELWTQATTHRFVRAVGDGSLPEDAFHTWIEQDYRFLEALERFVRALATRAPDEDRAGLITAATMLAPEFELFRAYAKREHLDLSAEPCPACREYMSFLDASAAHGYAHGLTAYYACERSYLEAWRFASGFTDENSPYASWIDNWASSEFGAFVRWIGQRLDDAPKPDTETLIEIFRRTVGYEIAFWDACWSD